MIPKHPSPLYPDIDLVSIEVSREGRHYTIEAQVDGSQGAADDIRLHGKPFVDFVEPRQKTALNTGLRHDVACAGLLRVPAEGGSGRVRS